MKSAHQRSLSGPSIGDLEPGVLTRRSMQQDGHHDVVAVGEGVGLDPNAVADDPLDREAAAVDARRDLLDDRPPPPIGRAEVRILDDGSGLRAEVLPVGDGPCLGGPGRLESVGHAGSADTTSPLAQRADDDAIRVGRFTL